VGQEKDSQDQHDVQDADVGCSYQVGQHYQLQFLQVRTCRSKRRCFFTIPSLFDQHGASVILARTVLHLKNMSILKQSSGKINAVITLNNVVSIYWMKEIIVNVKTFC